jgi:hypothetical protein
MKYTIECDGILYGPFATDREAADWALKHCAMPRRLRSIHVIPLQQERSGKTDGQK